MIINDDKINKLMILMIIIDGKDRLSDTWWYQVIIDGHYGNKNGIR
jgi:hypothetical protein